MNEFYHDFLKEDGLVEYSTAILFFSAFSLSVLLGSMFIRKNKKLFGVLYLLMSIVFFVIASEEISWGQRIFEIETPEFFNKNYQNEMNFHNLPIINDYIQNLSFLILGAIAFTMWVIFTHSDNLKDKLFTKFFVPPKFTMPYFILVMIFNEMYLFEQYIPQSSEGFLFYIFKWPDHELFEFLLSVGIFIFVVSKIIKLKNHQTYIKT